MKNPGRKPIQPSNPPNSNSETSKPNKNVDESTPPQEVGKDNMDISNIPQNIQNVKDVINGLPKIRIERVGEIKQSVDNGDYHVESEKIAKKMVNESLHESIHRKKVSLRSVSLRDTAVMSESQTKVSPNTILRNLIRQILLKCARGNDSAWN